MEKIFSNKKFYIVAAIFIPAVFFGGIAGKTIAAGTNISGTAGQYWAWNDLAGWMDFYSTNNVMVNSTGLAGYASSSLGDISLDCATTRAGNICGVSNYQVLNDGNGYLSGWGWNDQIGWISFCGGQGTSACPGVSVSYQVLIDSNGNFSGWAWNDLFGWISFNCFDIGGSNYCNNVSNYKVVTSWIATSTNSTLDSTTFDTGIQGGAQINSVTWNGVPGVGTEVDFQFAASNAPSGPWNYSGPNGGNSYFTGAAGVPIEIPYYLFNNSRYFRYRVRLVSDKAQRQTPRVDDIMINWSP